MGDPVGCIVDWNKNKQPTPAVWDHLNLGNIRPDSELVQGIEMRKRQLTGHQKYDAGLNSLLSRSQLMKEIVGAMEAKGDLHKQWPFCRDEGQRSRERYRRREAKQAFKQSQCRLLMGVDDVEARPRLKTSVIAAILNLTPD